MVNGQTNLLHCVPVANGDGVLLHIVGGIAFNSFEINCYAERGTDFVLAAITFADCTGLIVIDHEMLGQHCIKLFGFVAELLLKRKNGGLVGSERGMQMQNVANIAVFESLLIVAIAEECESHATCADGGFDTIRNVSGIRERIHVFHALAAVFRMSFKVIIGAACNAPEFTPTERETIFDIGCAVGIVAKLFG